MLFAHSWSLQAYRIEPPKTSNGASKRIDWSLHFNLFAKTYHLVTPKHPQSSETPIYRSFQKSSLRPTYHSTCHSPCHSPCHCTCHSARSLIASLAKNLSLLTSHFSLLIVEVLSDKTLPSGYNAIPKARATAFLMKELMDTPSLWAAAAAPL